MSTLPDEEKSPDPANNSEARQQPNDDDINSVNGKPNTPFGPFRPRSKNGVNRGQAARFAAAAAAAAAAATLTPEDQAALNELTGEAAQEPAEPAAAAEPVRSEPPGEAPPVADVELTREQIRTAAIEMASMSANDYTAVHRQLLERGCEFFNAEWAKARAAQLRIELNGGPPPDPVVAIPESLPELIDMKRWIVSDDAGKPLIATKVENSAAWMTFADACKALDRIPGANDVGFVFTGQVVKDGYTLICVDMDSCFDANGAMTWWGTDAIKSMRNGGAQPYVARSRSCTGAHVLMWVKKGDYAMRKHYIDTTFGRDGVGDHKPQTETFGGVETARYVRLTGNTLGELVPIPHYDEVDHYSQRYGPDAAPTKPGAAETFEPSYSRNTSELTDDMIRERIGIREELLTGGDWEGYKSPSEAYFAIVNAVLHACHRDGQRTLEFLLTGCGVWSDGTVRDSADPGKYSKPEWIEGRVLKATGTTDGERPDFTAAGGDEQQDGSEPPRGDSFAAELLADCRVDVAKVAAEQLSMARFDTEMVPHLLHRRQLICLGSGPKAGKTTLLQSILSGFALDDPREFEGFGKPAKPLRTLFFSENPGTFDALQMRGMMAANGCKDTYRITVISAAKFRQAASKRKMPLKTFGDVLAVVRVLVKEHRSDVVVLDTFESWTPDAEDTNQSSEIVRQLGLATQLAYEMNVAVIAVLHLNKASKSSLEPTSFLGSVKFAASSSMNIVMQRVAPGTDDRRIQLSHEGRNALGFICKLAGGYPAGVPADVRERLGSMPPPVLCYEPTWVKTVKGCERQPLDGGPDFGGVVRYVKRPLPKEAEKGSPVGDDQIELVITRALQLRAADGDTSPVGVRMLVVGDGSYAEVAAAQLGTPMSGKRGAMSRAKVISRAPGLEGARFKTVRGSGKAAKSGLVLTEDGRKHDCTSPPFDGLDGEVADGNGDSD